MTLLVAMALDATAQNVTPLFTSSKPIAFEAKSSVKATKKAATDSTYSNATVRYQDESGAWHDLTVGRKGRGNFRMETCYFPPLKIKLKKKETENTIFEGNKNLKLVTPCMREPNMNQYILREYLCYKFYQLVSPIHLNVRLIKVNLTDTTTKKPKVYKLTGFLVEDNDLVAARAGGTIRKGIKLHPRVLQNEAAVRHDLFQYMIGNADWSTVNDHNANIIFVEPRTYYPLPYDFDMAGMVNASYARANAPNLGTGDIRERVYRGFCRPEPIMDSIRKEFLGQRAAMEELIRQYSSELGPTHTKDMLDYLDSFFTILESDSLFREKILGTCRTKE